MAWETLESLKVMVGQGKGKVRRVGGIGIYNERVTLARLSEGYSTVGEPMSLTPSAWIHTVRGGVSANAG